MARTFEDKPAVRERVPLLIGLCGSSGSGKTFSALRLATGIQEVCGGDIGFLDTEARRALWYADRFKFQHLDFQAPFGPLDYLAAVEHFAKKGCKVCVVDSQSHSHEGPGGTLEAHDTEVQRLAAAWKSTPDKVTFAAWQKPKAELRRYLNTLLQMPINFIFTFRAREKMKPVAGGQPKPLGFMPIMSDEFIYEMSLNALLYPNSGGVPSWHPDEMGERAIIKLPVQFREIFKDNKPLDEETGKNLAAWAEGGAAAIPSLPDTSALITEIKSLLATLPTQEAKKTAVAAAFNLPWAKVERLEAGPLSLGLASLKAAVSPPAVVSAGDHRERIRAHAEQVGLPAESIAAVIGGSLDDLPADLETMALAQIGVWLDEKGA